MRVCLSGNQPQCDTFISEFQMPHIRWLRWEFRSAGKFIIILDATTSSKKTIHYIDTGEDSLLFLIRTFCRIIDALFL